MNHKASPGRMEFCIVLATLHCRRYELLRNMQLHSMKIKTPEGILTMTKHSIQSNDSIQANDFRTPLPVTRIPWWVAIIVILGALLTVSGAVISKMAPTILTNGSPITDAVRVYA